MIYEYRVLTGQNDGAFKHGQCLASSHEELLKIIEYRFPGGMLVSYKRKKLSYTKPVDELAIHFFQNIYTLVSNSIDIMDALRITESSFEDVQCKAVVNYLVYRISNGSSLCVAMKSAAVFDDVCIKAVEIAEKTATLPRAFQYCLEYIKENSENKKLIKNTLIYPAVLLAVILSVTFAWIFFIIPNFAESFIDIGIKIPTITRFLLGFRNFCINHQIATTLIIIVIAVCAIWQKNRLLNMIPIIKKTKKSIANFRFFSSMSLMLQEKISFIEALQASASDDNAELKSKIKTIELMIKSGHSISKSFEQSGWLSNTENSIIRAGEVAGNMYGAFKIISDKIKMDTKHSINRATTMLQPVVTIIMGLILIVVVCSVLVPIYDQLGNM
ncbi:MAG: type II secretion system F family protein [Holosporales bacterium]|jgi:type II secretory pathway component PulF|nr:type II secretion system F family protein [Holosporales bacterium]